MKRRSVANGTLGLPADRPASCQGTPAVLAAEHSSARKLSTWVRIFPVVFFISYLNLTVLLFAFGPWDYPVNNQVALYVFLVLAHLALLAGYLTAAFREPRGYSGRWTISRLTQISVLVSLALLPATSRFRTGSVIPDVISGIKNPGEAYAYSQLLRDIRDPFIEYIRIFLGPLTCMLLPLTVFYWRRLNVTLRILGVAGVLGTVALYVAMGTNKAVADTVFLVPWLVLAAHIAGALKLNRIQIINLAAGGIVALVLFLSLFSSAVTTRTGSTVSAGYFLATKTHVDYNNSLVRKLPEGAATTLIGLDYYLTSGYYALSLSLQEPFVPMFGVGNSMFLYRQAARITGKSEILNLPYPVRIERYGWDAQGLWSSIYPWIASDVSFPGTLIVIFFIGRLFALSWLDTLKGDNPFAVVIFSQFLIMLFYFPGNNQLLQSGEGFTAFLGILILWLITCRQSVRRLGQRKLARAFS